MSVPVDTERRLFTPIAFTFPYMIILLLGLKIESARYITFLTVLIFISAFFYFRQEKHFTIQPKYFFLLLFFAGYLLLGLANGSMLQIIKNISMVFVLMAPFFLFDWLFAEKNKKHLYKNTKAVLWVISPVLVYTIISTFYYLNKNPYLARYMATYDSDAASVVGLPIAIGGGYALIYGIIVLVPLFIYLGKISKGSFRTAVLFFSGAVILLAFIVKAGFATAFLVAVIAGISSLVIYGQQRAIFWFFAVIGILYSFLFMSSAFIIQVIYGLRSLLPDHSIIGTRLEEIIPILNGTSGNSSFSVRIDKLNESISAFLDHPLIGIGPKYGFDYTAVAAHTGFHTEWIDLLSQYGLLLGIPLMIFIFTTFVQLLKIFQDTMYSPLIKLSTLTLLCIGFLNPILNTSAFLIAFVFIPSLLVQHSLRQEYKEKVYSDILLNENKTSDNRMNKEPKVFLLR
ncbi:O-antigen ligase family protein [Jeotgalibacillus haloalkalitolerans]|uniref:O-antigen ligase family protein n=1 Tax=Jeotgalibacillus haloalkalitolerans TaxID=3104292 RepID=A0ABU5KJK8_9BACL|nr:O-antigen ligase family protein [Jeotgalibacillus sp. HH7-29]MDZ5710910.1 O-antigen ligase family protein [Jeotgalibacillus sp. HH7-29]